MAHTQESGLNRILKTSRFEVLRRLGHGATGSVYEVFDRERETRLALKTLPALSTSALLRLQTEIRLLQELKHPNLLNLGELFVGDEGAFFTMELVSGVPFLRHVRWHDPAGGEAGGFAEERLRPALLQLAEGLAFLHAAQRVHGNLKPSNLLVTEAGRVVLLDFGLVPRVDERRTRNPFLDVGEFYRAPEQAALERFGPEADWYGVGVVLYQSLTGVLPFVGRPRRLVELKQSMQPVSPAELLPEVPADLDQLCMDLLSADPALRPRDHDLLRRLGKDDAHERVAKTLEQSEKMDAEALANHWQEAGNFKRAADYAIVAAEKAMREVAFARAAGFYKSALELGTFRADRSALRLKLAEALVQAGRGAEAGQAFLDAATGTPDPDDSLELRRRAADQLLRAGFIDEGERVLGEVSPAVGPKRALAGKRTLFPRVRRRLTLYHGFRHQERDAQEIPKRTLLRSDAFLCAAAGLAWVDPLRGAEVHARHLAYALKTGEPSRVAVALGLEASFSALEGGRRSVETADALSEAERLAERLKDPLVTGRLLMSAAASAYLEGRWRAALEIGERAEAVLAESCRGVAWERAVIRLILLSSMAHLGELHELARRLPGSISDAQARGDRFALTSFSTGHLILADLAANDPERARRRSAEALYKWSRQSWDLQHYGNLVAQCEVDLYLGDARSAFDRVVGHFQDLKNARLLRIQMVRIHTLALRMRAALAVADSNGRASARAEASADIARLLRENMPWATPLARLGQAALAASSGQPKEAVSLLQRAEHGFDRASMRLHAALTRWRRGNLLGGGYGAELCNAAEAVLLRQGVQRPDRFVAMLSPGFVRA
jgi:hypothetical protein